MGRGRGKQPKVNNEFLRKLNRFAFNLIDGKINFHERHNSIYKDSNILNSLIFFSIRNRYPENGSKRYKEIAGKETPDADTFYRRIGKKSKKEILEEYMDIQKEILYKIKKRIRDERIIVLIDEHEIPWFGKPNPYVVGTKNFKGTSLCFKYITINVISDDYRICLFVLPVTQLDEEYKLVDVLLNKVWRGFNIELVLFDRGFSKDSKILKVVEKHGLKYLAPMEKGNRIKRVANLGDGVHSFYHTDYEFGKEKVKTNIFFIPNRKIGKEKWENYHVFCTNIDVRKVNIEYLADLYGKRWNIENFYRDAESNFMIKTKTADFLIRYFFFLFVSLLYNLWYFIRGFYPIIAEKWKDMIEDELRGDKDVDRINAILNEILRLKAFYFSFLFQLQDYLKPLFLRGKCVTKAFLVKNITQKISVANTNFSERLLLQPSVTTIRKPTCGDTERI